MSLNFPIRLIFLLISLADVFFTGDNIYFKFLILKNETKMSLIFPIRLIFLLISLADVFFATYRTS